MNVSNRGCIRRLSLKSLLANRTRNLVAVLAIALTAVLFTSLFTIALSINEGIQQNNFRQAGGWSHGSFKYLTEEQFEALKDDPLIESWGLLGLLRPGRGPSSPGGHRRGGHRHPCAGAAGGGAGDRRPVHRYL